MPHLQAAVFLAVTLLAVTPLQAQAVLQPLQLGYNNDTELAALQLALSLSLEIGSAFAEGREPQPRVGAMALPPRGVTPVMLASAMGQVLSSAVLDSEVLSTLGDPVRMPMGDGGRDALFRFPVPGIPIRGTCVFIHGCFHDPESWFYHSKRCPKCTGLPHEVAHTKGCLARGYAVLALASKDRSVTRCFSSSGDAGVGDQQDAKDAIQQFTSRFGLSKLPIYMWGVSSGAGFAIKFPLTMWVDGVVSEVNMPWEKSWGATDGKGHLLVRFPPTAFYMMQRDVETMHQIEKAVAILRSNGVPSEFLYLPSQPIYPSYFYRQSIYITKQQSAIIVAGLKAIGAINAQGWLNYDPRIMPKWIRQLPKVVPWVGGLNDPYYNLNTDSSQITESMNYAYAWHEIAGEDVRCTLMWLESKGTLNLTDVCYIYSAQGDLRCLTEQREGCPGVNPQPLAPPPRPSKPAKSPPLPNRRLPYPQPPPAKSQHEQQQHVASPPLRPPSVDPVAPTPRQQQPRTQPPAAAGPRRVALPALKAQQESVVVAGAGQTTGLQQEQQRTQLAPQQWVAGAASPAGSPATPAEAPH